MIKLIVVNSSRQKIRKREQKEKRKDRWEDRNCCADIKTEHSWPRQCNPYQCNLIKYNYNQSFVYHCFFICISYFPIVKSSIVCMYINPAPSLVSESILISPSLICAPNMHRHYQFFFVMHIQKQKHCLYFGSVSVLIHQQIELKLHCLKGMN